MLLIPGVPGAPAQAAAVPPAEPRAGVPPSPAPQGTGQTEPLVPAGPGRPVRSAGPAGTERRPKCCPAPPADTAQAVATRRGHAGRGHGLRRKPGASPDRRSGSAQPAGPGRGRRGGRGGRRGRPDPEPPHGVPHQRRSRAAPPARAGPRRSRAGRGAAAGPDQALAAPGPPHSPSPPTPPSWIHVSRQTSAEAARGWLRGLSPWRQRPQRAGPDSGAPCCRCRRRRGRAGPRLAQPCCRVGRGRRSGPQRVSGPAEPTGEGAARASIFAEGSGLPAVGRSECVGAMFGEGGRSRRPRMAESFRYGPTGRKGNVIRGLYILYCLQKNASKLV